MSAEYYCAPSRTRTDDLGVLEALALPLSYRGWRKHAPGDRKLVLFASCRAQTFAITFDARTNVAVGGATTTVVDALLPPAFIADPREAVEARVDFLTPKITASQFEESTFLTEGTLRPAIWVLRHGRSVSHPLSPRQAIYPHGLTDSREMPGVVDELLAGRIVNPNDLSGVTDRTRTCDLQRWAGALSN